MASKTDGPSPEIGNKRRTEAVEIKQPCLDYIEGKTKIKAAVTIGATLLVIGSIQAQQQMEKMGRGSVSINQGGGKVYVGWRMLGTDPDDVAFNLYRTTDRRLCTLTHEPIYRLSATWHNGAYNKPTQPGFYFGEGMAVPPHPDIVLVGIDN